MLIDALLNALLPSLIVCLLGFFIWLIFGRKTGGFLKYLGLTAPPTASLGAALVVAAVTLASLLLLKDFAEIAAAPDSVIGRLAARGPSPQTYGLLAIQALIGTALWEELFFRGLLGKRLIARFGFWVGNTAQALVFGALHLLILYAVRPDLVLTPRAALVVAVTGGGGWLWGLLNERLGRGSIFPGWVAHGASNLAAYALLAFGLPW